MIKDLIKQIIPYYNYYRKNKSSISVNNAIESMWDIGELIQLFLNENPGIKPHSLYREIYGKSEGSKNIEQKSYITREFLGRCYRIRQIFKFKRNIKETFPNLKSFTNFREAMPFFDNDKYKLNGKDLENLIKILNSKESNIKIFTYIKDLQKVNIGIKNPRNQKIKELSGDKEIFVKFYNYIYGLLKFNDYDKAYNEIKSVDNNFIKILSKNTAAIAIDGLLMTDFEIPNLLNKDWENYSILIKRMINKKDSTERRRFRRLIPPHRMTQLGEMLYQISSKDLYKTFRQ